MRLRTFVASLVLALLGAVGAQADTYPSRPVTIIVPFPAGGPTDTIARILGEHMAPRLASRC